MKKFNTDSRDSNTLLHTSNEVDVGEEDVTVELINTDLHVPCLQAIPLSREMQVCPQLKK